MEPWSVVCSLPRSLSNLVMYRSVSAVTSLPAPRRPPTDVWEYGSSNHARLPTGKDARSSTTPTWSISPKLAGTLRLCEYSMDLW